MGAPVSPLGVSLPAREAGPEQTQPDGALPVLNHSGDVVAGQALFGVDDLPARSGLTCQPAIGRNQKTARGIERQSRISVGRSRGPGLGLEPGGSAGSQIQRRSAAYPEIPIQVSQNSLPSVA